MPVNLAATLYNKTNGAVVVAALNTLGVLYIVENGETVQSISDLAGKTLYASARAARRIYLNYLLEKNGDGRDRRVCRRARGARRVASGRASRCRNRTCPPGQERERARARPDRGTRSAIPSSCRAATWCRRACTIHKKAVDAFFDRSPTRRQCEHGRGRGGRRGAGHCAVRKGWPRARSRAATSCVRGDEMKAAVSAMLKVLFDANPKSVGGALPGDELYAG